MASVHLVTSSDLAQSYYQTLFLTCVLTILFWGISILQLFMYFKDYYYKDSRNMKWFILVVYVCDTIQQIFMLRWGHRLLVRESGSTHVIHTLKWDELPILTISFCINEMLIQFFYVKRIWSLSKKNIPLTVIVSISVAAQQAIVLYEFAETCKLSAGRKSDAEVLGLSDVAIALYSVTTFTEILLACVLVFLLRSIRVGYQRCDSIVDTLVCYAIGSGCATALTSSVATAMAIAHPDSPLHFLFGYLETKIYTNSMLALLNSRNSIKDRLDGDPNGQTDIEIEATQIRFAGDTGFSTSLSHSTNV